MDVPKMLSSGNKHSIVMDKYLKHYAEAEINFLTTFPRQLNLNTALIIPAYREGPDFITRLICAAFSNRPNLYIIVINQPQDDDDMQPQQLLNDTILATGSCLWKCGNLSLIKIEKGESYFLIVNRFSASERIPLKQGVGLARKIGCDLATLLYQQHLLSNNWLCSSDADALLPTNYLDALVNLSTQQQLSSAAVFDFEHISAAAVNKVVIADDSAEHSDEITSATLTYQRALRYYVKGLKWAGSCYAFYTIGSLLAINIHSYCQVRGFPKRAAGEDFYLLNKLAKVGLIESIADSKVLIISRLSDRVPFGTGPMVKKILQSGNSSKFTYYSPHSFRELKELLQSFDCLWAERFRLSFWKNELSLATKSALMALHFFDFIQTLSQQCKTELQFNRQINQWFDAFKTLKYLNHLRDHYYDDEIIDDAIIELNQLIEK